MSSIRAPVISAWRGITRRPALAWGAAGAAVLAAAAGSAVAAMSGGGGAPAPNHAASGHVASSHAASGQDVSGQAAPVVAIGTFTGRRPSEIDFSADGGNIVTRIRWLSWTGSGATGRGVSGMESCVPDCAQGAVRYVPTTITLSDAVNGKFTVLGETRAGQVTMMRWPAQWPLAASQSASRPAG